MNVLALLLVVAAAAQAPQPPAVHDPVMIRQDGTYYLFSTGTGISVHSSTDMQTWKPEPPVFERAPEWTFAAVPGFKGRIWAPDISEHDGIYYLYYAISLGGKITSAIGVATNETLDRSSPAFQWKDRGMVVQSVVGRDLWNAIDAQLFVDERGTPWMAFGSFWSGIKLVALNPSTGKRADSTIHSIAGRNGGAIEAPVIVQRGNYFYQWVSFDRCCQGASSTYRVMVGRSTSVTGPYTDRNGTPMTSGGGTQVLAGHGSIHGPGHQAVLADDDGDSLVYHYYADNGAALLGINRIGYDAAGWPFVY